MLEEVPEEIEKEFMISNKELKLLGILRSRDIDADSAMALLHVKKIEFDSMAKNF